MGPVIFTRDGIAVDTSLAALFMGRRREYPLPKNLLAIKPKHPAPSPSPSAHPPAPAPDSTPAPDPNPPSDPAPAPAPDQTSAPGPAPTSDPNTVQAPEPDAAPQPVEVVPVPWTEIQDAMLRGLKDYQNKSWREIGALIDGRDSEECRERYDELVAMVIAEKMAKDEEKAKVKKEEEQAKEEAEMRTWWANHKAEKAKAAQAEQKAKEEEAKKEEVIAAEKAVKEEVQKEAMATQKAKKEESKKESKATRAEKKTKEREAKQEESDTTADTSSNKDKKGKKDKTKGKDKTTSSGKGKGKDRETSAKYQAHCEDASPSPTSKFADRPIINLEGLDEEEIEEVPLLWHLHSQSQGQKWNEMAARYFEATGQQIPADVLEKKLRTMGIRNV